MTREALEGINAILRAQSRVRGGRWVTGAPTHVFAELLNELEAEGWHLTCISPDHRSHPSNAPGPTKGGAVSDDSEMLERMAVIELLAKYLADPSDDRECDCMGDGIDEEGAEWTLCECVLRRIGEPSSSASDETADERVWALDDSGHGKPFVCWGPSLNLVTRVVPESRALRAEEERDEAQFQAEARGAEKDRHRREKIASQERERKLREALREAALNLFDAGALEGCREARAAVKSSVEYAARSRSEGP